MQRPTEPRASYSIDAEGFVQVLHPQEATSGYARHETMPRPDPPDAHHPVNREKALKNAKTTTGPPIWPPRASPKSGKVFYVPRADCCDDDNNVIFCSWEVVERHRWNGAVEGFVDLKAAGDYLLEHRRVGEYRLIFT